MNAAQNSPSGFQDGKAPRDRDISLLVLDDHAAFRRWFALLDEVEGEAEAEASQAGGKAPSSEARDNVGVSGKISTAVGKAASAVGVGSKRTRSPPSEEIVRKLKAIWDQLSLHLEIHADAEEKLLYPTLVRDGGKGAADETKDAIGDHNKIRDAIVESQKHEVGSSDWWTAVGKARTENTEHLGEEEDEALPDFRRHTSKARRVELGEKWIQFYRDHPQGKNLDLTHDNDPDAFVKKYEQQKKERKAQQAQ